MGPSIGLVLHVCLRMDNIYPGPNCGGSQELILLALRLVLVFKRATKYIVDC